MEDEVSESDRELWEYFSTLYKNSNKGIKGRGKDRRIKPLSGDSKGFKIERVKRNGERWEVLKLGCKHEGVRSGTRDTLQWSGEQMLRQDESSDSTCDAGMHSTVGTLAGGERHEGKDKSLKRTASILVLGDLRISRGIVRCMY